MSRLFRVLLCAGLLPLAVPVPVLAQGAEDHRAAAADVKAGSLVIAQGFTRATRPGAPVAGGFMTITNTSTTDDRLVAASSAVAGVMQVHEMTMADGVMKMRELADGLAIPAGGTVMLKPGGYHVMFLDLKEPLVEGKAIDVTLTFEKAGTVTVPLAILAPDAEGFDGHGS